VPSGYLKLRTAWFDPVTLSLRGGLAYLDAKAIAELADDDAEASALSSTADVAVSYLISPEVTASFGLDWAHLDAVGKRKDPSASIQGASTSHTVSVRAFGEWRFTRVFAMTFLVRYLVYQSPLETTSTTETGNVTGEEDLTVNSTGGLRRLLLARPRARDVRALADPRSRLRVPFRSLLMGEARTQMKTSLACSLVP
jgi:hypothetical protein